MGGGGTSGPADRPDAGSRLDGVAAVVTGAASGLGAATAGALVARGARVALLDRDLERLEAVRDRLSGRVRAYAADVTEEEPVRAALEDARARLGELRVAVLCAGVGWAQRVLGRDGQPAAIGLFESVVHINLVGTYNTLRLVAASMSGNRPDPGGERGVVVMTASVAAFDGQVGQTAYAASKGGVAALTLPAARDLAVVGVRVCSIAPGVFETPMLAGLPEQAREALRAAVPFPPRLGRPEEFALLACQIAEHPYLNGEVVRLDAALRMAPR
jgi:NAD(P)-dependent dehydrogenase (short-subunit alcohol dehydrogenase family)